MVLFIHENMTCRIKPVTLKNYYLFFKWSRVQQPVDGGFRPNHYSKMGGEVVAAAPVVAAITMETRIWEIEPDFTCIK